MKLLLLAALLTTTLSANALECVADKTGDGSFYLLQTEKKNLYLAHNKDFKNYFIGKETAPFNSWGVDLGDSEYTLYNQDGKEFILTKKTEITTIQCRARVCPSQSQTTLKLSTEGKEDVYFNCL